MICLSNAIKYSDFIQLRRESEMELHNIHQLDLWLNGSITDSQLNSNIKIDANGILPTEPWPRPVEGI